MLLHVQACVHVMCVDFCILYTQCACLHHTYTAAHGNSCLCVCVYVCVCVCVCVCVVCVCVGVRACS